MRVSVAVQDGPVVADSVLLIEQLAVNAWPAATVQHAAGWAADQGANHLYPQVEEDNLPALRLYQGLGLQPSHRYHYRVAPP